ncbi:hypothetical protein [Actinoplanes sp. NPDC023714]|uniref:hypothetical protein n=1 Tax=Actinoplanes sp. NPDC023714 TaxID=3154322 RepID=UPI0033D1CD9F
MAAAPDHRDGGVDDGYLLAKRAQVRNHLYLLGDEHGRRDARLLDGALADWLDERAVPHRHDPSVVRALLNRAQVRARRNDTPGARADRELARRLYPAGASDRTAAKLRAVRFEELVEKASAADDLERLRALATTIIASPPDDPLPTAALVRACKILARHLPEDEWRPLLADALDRIEIDLVHPSLSEPAVRPVAGHAALLAWLLGRRTDDADTLARAIHLYRTSFAAFRAEPPSIDALVNAGACALQLGRIVQAGAEEAEGPVAGGLFAEGLAWTEAGLARAPPGRRAEHPGGPAPGDRPQGRGVRLRRGAAGEPQPHGRRRPAPG